MMRRFCAVFSDIHFLGRRPEFAIPVCRLIRQQ